MKIRYCIDCGKELIIKKKIPPLRCRSCYVKYHRRNSPLCCTDCGKKLNPKSARITKRCRLCWLKSHSTKFKESNYDDAFGNWLAGFTDGEGNFQMTPNHSRSFRINLREDDRTILEEIRNKLGCGIIHFLRKSKYNSNTRDQYQYTVATFVDLVNIIIPIFDKFHLRAKKQTDYLNWRISILNQWEKVMKGG